MSLRIPSLSIAAALVVAAIGVAAIGAGPAAADPPIPDPVMADPVGETAEARLARRLQALCSSKDPAEIAAWSLEMAAEGRRRASTPFGASLLAGAAHELARAPGREAETLALWREARASSAPDSAVRLEADWNVGAALLSAGDATEALASLLAFEQGARAAAAVSPSPFDSRQAMFLAGTARLAERVSPKMRAQALVALGRFAEAADLYEAVAERMGADAFAWDVFDDAARAAWRAGDRARALRDADRSVDAAPAGSARVTAEQLRLLARHGFVDARGDPAISGSPSEDFAREAQETLARVQGSDGAWTLAVQVAVLFALSGKPKEALPFYEWAFSDPAFLAAARADGADRDQLLVGAQEALRAGDPERAQRWLRTAESVAGRALPGTADLRARIDDALALAAREPPREPPANPPAAPPAPAGPPRTRAGLGAAPQGDGPAVPAGEVEVSDAGSRVPWVALLAGAAAIAIATFVSRKRLSRKGVSQRGIARGRSRSDPPDG